MKVLYVSSSDISYIDIGNGTDYFKMEALKQAGCEVIKHSPILPHRSVLFRLYERARRLATGRYRLPHMTKALLKKIDLSIKDHPLHNSVDVVLCPNQFDASLYSGSKPLFTWTDGTYKNLVDLYPAFASAPASVKHQGHLAQTATIARANGGMWSSQFALRSAIEDYDADRSKQVVVPFGLNLFNENREFELAKLIQSRSREVLNLLFIGFDFERKGWQTAVETALELNRRQIPTRLNMIGGQPWVPEEGRSFINVFGQLNKSKAEHLSLFDALMREAHFLILPTKADLSPMSPIEAMSYGCPTLITDVGGSREVVSHGETGMVFPKNTVSSVYVAKLQEIWLNAKRYEELCYAAYHRYKQCFVWSNLGKTAKCFMEGIINSGS
jgi:glycosyltransferase involved in cell wall biosynthesis